MLTHSGMNEVTLLRTKSSERFFYPICGDSFCRGFRPFLLRANLTGAGAFWRFDEDLVAGITLARLVSVCRNLECMTMSLAISAATLASFESCRRSWLVTSRWRAEVLSISKADKCVDMISLSLAEVRTTSYIFTDLARKSEIRHRLDMRCWKNSRLKLNKGPPHTRFGLCSLCVKASKRLESNFYNNLKGRLYTTSETKGSIKSSDTIFFHDILIHAHVPWSWQRFYPIRAIFFLPDFVYESHRDGLDIQPGLFADRVGSAVEEGDARFLHENFHCYGFNFNSIFFLFNWRMAQRSMLKLPSLEFSLLRMQQYPMFDQF